RPPAAAPPARGAGGSPWRATPPPAPPRRPAPARRLPPGGVINLGFLPTRGGPHRRVPPFLAPGLRRGHDVHDRRRRPVQLAISRGDLGGVHLYERAVVREHAVDFDLDVGGLGVDGGRQSTTDERPETDDEPLVPLRQLLRRLERAVSPIPFGLPGVPLYGQP